MLITPIGARGKDCSGGEGGGRGVGRGAQFVLDFAPKADEDISEISFFKRSVLAKVQSEMWAFAAAKKNVPNFCAVLANDSSWNMDDSDSDIFEGEGSAADAVDGQIVSQPKVTRTNCNLALSLQMLRNFVRCCKRATSTRLKCTNNRTA